MAEEAIIEEGLACGQRPEDIGRQVSLIQVLNAYTPDYRNRSTPSSETKSFANDYQARFMNNFRVYDWYRQIQAMQSHDVTAPFDGSRETSAAMVQAKTLVIVSRRDHLVPPGPAEEWAALTGAELVIFENDCGHLAPGCEMERFIRVVNDFFSKKE
jgi:homoserine O-acetyltransferase